MIAMKTTVILLIGALFLTITMNSFGFQIRNDSLYSVFHVDYRTIEEYEEEQPIESWMTTPFVYEEEVGMESWMVTPFVYEKEVGMESWMVTPFVYEEEVGMESWMSESWK